MNIQDIISTIINYVRNMGQKDLVIFTLIFYTLYKTKCIEKTSNTDNPLSTENLAAIRNLGNFAKELQDGNNIVLPGDVKINGKLSVGPEENVIISKAEGNSHIASGGKTGMIKLRAKTTEYGIIRGYKNTNVGGISVPNLLWIKDDLNVNKNATIRDNLTVNSSSTIKGDLAVEGDNATFGARQNIKFVKGNHEQGEIKLRNGTNIDSVKDNYESIQGYAGTLYIPGKSIFKKKAHFQLPQNDGNGIEVGNIKINGRLYIDNNYVDSIEVGGNNDDEYHRMATCEDC